MKRKMNKSKDLTGIKFGKLKVLSKAESILGGNLVKRYWGAWNCQCDCGNYKIIKTVDLNRKSVTSCGCLYSEFGKKYIPGQKINRLTTVSYNCGIWNCVCECGNKISVKTDALTCGNTKSCGCLKKEISSKNSTNLIKSRRKNEPSIASARRVWRNYCNKDINCNLIFKEFMLLSQQNCNYCGVEPHTKYNYFSIASSRGSIKSKNEGSFIYNGLDRIDSSKYHTIDNVVTCCFNCNRAKNNRSVKDFLEWVTKLKTTYEPFAIKNIKFPKGSLATSVKCIFYNYKNDTDIGVEEFYSISQMNCFYCNGIPNNKFNRAQNDKKSSEKAKANGDYIYNGLDRIDNSLSHSRNNIVPCCKYCNFVKSDLTLSEFENWIRRLQEKRQNILAF